MWVVIDDVTDFEKKFLKGCNLVERLVVRKNKHDQF